MGMLDLIGDGEFWVIVVCWVLGVKVIWVSLWVGVVMGIGGSFFFRWGGVGVLELRVEGIGIVFLGFVVLVWGWWKRDLICLKWFLGVLILMVILGFLGLVVEIVVLGFLRLLVVKSIVFEFLILIVFVVFFLMVVMLFVVVDLMRLFSVGLEGECRSELCIGVLVMVLYDWVSEDLVGVINDVRLDLDWGRVMLEDDLGIGIVFVFCEIGCFVVVLFLICWWVCLIGDLIFLICWLVLRIVEIGVDCLEWVCLGLLRLVLDWLCLMFCLSGVMWFDWVLKVEGWFVIEFIFLNLFIWVELKWLVLFLVVVILWLLICFFLVFFVLCWVVNLILILVVWLWIWFIMCWVLGLSFIFKWLGCLNVKEEDGIVILVGVDWMVLGSVLLWEEVGLIMLVKFRCRLDEGGVMVGWYLVGCIFVVGGLMWEILLVGVVGSLVGVGVGVGVGDVMIVLMFWIVVFLVGVLFCLVMVVRIGFLWDGFIVWSCEVWVSGIVVEFWYVCFCLFIYFLGVC